MTLYSDIFGRTFLLYIFFHFCQQRRKCNFRCQYGSFNLAIGGQFDHRLWRPTAFIGFSYISKCKLILFPISIIVVLQIFFFGKSGNCWRVFAVLATFCLLLADNLIIACGAAFIALLICIPQCELICFIA